MEEKVKKILIALNEDEWRALNLLKELANLNWEEVLKLGGLFIVERFGGEEEVLKLIEKMLETTNYKSY